MMARIQKRKTLACLLCVLLLCLLLPVDAYAAGSSLTLRYPFDSTPFRVYLAAIPGEAGSYELADAFSAYSVEIPGESWRDCAATLAAYAARDQILPDAVAETRNGEAVFQSLSPGLYLVVGNAHQSEDKLCTPVPVLITITEGSFSIHIKYDQEDSESGTPRAYSVTKRWINDTSQIRPNSVSIQLLCNGQVWDSVTLSAANRWFHTWENLDSTFRWQVVEASVPDGYSVSVSQAEYFFTVTNTYQSEETPPTDSSEPPETTKPSHSDTPQTGDDTLIWPYLLMLALGLAGILAALLGNRKQQKH